MLSQNDKNIPLLSAPGTMRLLLAVVSSYILLASVLVYVMERPAARAFNLYYFLIIALAAFLSILSAREVKFGPIRIPMGWRSLRVAAMLGLGLAIWIGYRYPQLFSISLWIDEITQFQGDWQLPKTVADPALFAATQQQPPIDYYLSAFARHILGISEFSVLVHAIAFGVLSFVLFLLWLMQIRFPVVLAPVPILMFAAHHALLRFSSEARPISVAVFFCLAVLMFVYESVERRKISFAAIGASSLLLLYSTGLQPMFFLAALALSLLPLLAWRFGAVGALKFVLVLAVGPLLLFLPTLWEIYRESERLSQFLHASYFELWWKALGALSWNSFWPYSGTMSYAKWVLWIPPLALLLVPCLKKRGFGCLPGTFFWALAGLIYSLIFPLAFQIFWSIVNWNNNWYYFVLWPVGVFALASLCVARISSPFLEGKNAAAAALVMAAVSGGATFALHKYYAPAHRAITAFDYSLRPNWHLVQEKARGAARPVVVVEIPYGGFGNPPYHSISGRFYESLPEFRVVRLDVWNKNHFGIPAFRIRETMEGFDQPSDMIYLISLIDVAGNRLGQERKERILTTLRAQVDEVTALGESIYLLRANNQASPVAKTEAIFRKIIEADPNSDHTFYLADALAGESIARADCPSARKWLAVMDQVNTEAHKGPHDSLTKYLSLVGGDIARLPACGASLGMNQSK